MTRTSTVLVLVLALAGCGGNPDGLPPHAADGPAASTGSQAASSVRAGNAKPQHDAPDAGAGLLLALTDPDNRVRIDALSEAAQTMHGGDLLRDALGDADVSVRLQVLDEAARLSAAEAAGVLLRATDDARAIVREEALLAMGEVAPQVARDAALRLLQDPDPAVREVACEILAGDDRLDRLPPCLSLGDVVE